MLKHVKMHPCPFCGQEIDISDCDTFYPSGIVWREDSELQMRTYHRYSERTATDNHCWKIVCSTSNGSGCGVEINGDTKDEVIAKWNTRVK